jgi:hypothetical protein
VWTFTSKGLPREEIPISFPIPLSVADAANVSMEFVKGGGTKPNCLGTPMDPQAKPGFLCLYAATFRTEGTPGFVNNPFPAGQGTVAPDPESEDPVGPSGTFVFWEEKAAGDTVGGSFAVTAP